MKRNILFTLLFISMGTSGQVIIDPGTKTQMSSPAVSLEFGDNMNRGIVLPYTTDAITAVDGTLILDAPNKQVKLRANGAWVDLSGGAAINAVGVDVAIQTTTATRTERPAAKVMIGNPALDAETVGILVLTDTDKAMILPRMASPHTAIINPAAGMLAYDTVKKQLAVFNGTQWSFWKP